MKLSKVLGMGLSVGMLATSALAGTQQGVDVSAIQGRLRQETAAWQARESWVTRLSQQELQRMLGLQRPPQGRLDYESVRSALPGAARILDWRNLNGVNWLGPVMNQGNCGSCVAFSTIATLEARTSIAAGTPWLHPTYSSQALFACGGGGCETGWEPGEASEFLKHTGVPDEACLPYTSGSTGLDVACTQLCGDANSRSLRITGYNMPSSYGGSVDAVKAALKQGPLMTTLLVYSDFVTYGSGVYKHVVGEAVGGHAVSLVGYDDLKRAWLIRNSWGAEWGEKGFAWISWDDTSGVGADTWALQIPAASGHLSVSSPADREYVSGQYAFTAQGMGLQSTDIRFHLKDLSGREVATVACLGQAGQGCTSKLDTTQLKEGRYEIFAEAATGTSYSLQSQVREFFVLNSVPKMSLSFTVANGVNLSAPLSGRPEFTIQALSTPVPIQHLEFRVVDSKGKIVSVKSNDYVLEQMKMGWRTVTVSDGQYKILFHGETTYRGELYSVDSSAVAITVKN